MLAIETLNNQEKVVYTVPTGKTVMAFIDINPVTDTPTCTIKINDVVYWSGTMYGIISIKVTLSSSDTVKVSTDGQINVFVHGLVI